MEMELEMESLGSLISPPLGLGLGMISIGGGLGCGGSIAPEEEAEQYKGLRRGGGECRYSKTDFDWLF